MNPPHRDVTHLGRELGVHSHAVISRRELNRMGVDRFAVRVQVRHARPDVAALRAASWAHRASGRRVALDARLPRPAPVERMLTALDALPTLRRRRILRRLLLDIAGGSEAVSELDFLAECRRRGIPLPDRQVKRRGDNGAMHLDAFWKEARLCVEIDGAHHFVGDIPVRDAFRQNELALQGEEAVRPRASE